MENEKEKLEFPPPPDYYKEFTSPDKYSPPKLSTLNKLDKFITFGNVYSTKDLNISYNPVDISGIGKKLAQSTKMSNYEFFKEIKNKSSSNINCDNINIIEELQKEIEFLRERYKLLLNDIAENINKAPNKLKLIGVCIQKINFYLIALRRKAILQKTIKFYNDAIDDSEETSKKVDEGINNFRNYLKEGLEKLK